jgi:hypothetical protein
VRFVVVMVKQQRRPFKAKSLSFIEFRKPIHKELLLPHAGHSAIIFYSTTTPLLQHGVITGVIRNLTSSTVILDWGPPISLDRITLVVVAVL